MGSGAAGAPRSKPSVLRSDLLSPLVVSDAMIRLFPFLPGQIRVLFKIFEKSELGLPCYPC